MEAVREAISGWAQDAKKHAGWLVVLGVVTVIAASPAAAQAPAGDAWKITVTPYFMGASMTGTTAVAGQEATIDVSFSDLLKNLQFGAMGLVTARKGDWGAFSEAVKASHISFGPRHEDVVRAFVVSLATKRFVILTGLSGSGKTQIAVKFGDWLGPGRSLVVAVRPDWTGPESLFGYEDALQECTDDGRRAWHVPEVLEFMLKAARDPKSPYLLVLDEMNLAHVERYFADVLSGMESMQPCLPNLRLKDGYWRVTPGEAPKLLYPRNLFIVGTVNVDETTYMFSPKVLDRANTLELRVDTSDLSEGTRKPTLGTCG